MPATEANIDQPLYRSRFGGLWIDRLDAPTLLQQRLDQRLINDREAEQIHHFIEHGYLVLKGAVDLAVIDAYNAFFEEAWRAPPPFAFAHCEGKVLPLDLSLYTKVAKVSNLHYYFDQAESLAFARPVRRFLELIYERPPVVFQSMSMRKGSEEPLHIDTGPLCLTEPMTLVAAWVALEDVQPKSGPLGFVPGSHRVKEILNNGVSKAHNKDFVAYGKVLAGVLAECDARGLPRQELLAKKGDVFLWAADLMHGGMPIEDHALTRKSLVFHYMPLGVMPTFYDFSNESYVKYPGGGYRLDPLKPQSEAAPSLSLRKQLRRLIGGFAAQVLSREMLDKLRRQLGR